MPIDIDQRILTGRRAAVPQMIHRNEVSCPSRMLSVSSPDAMKNARFSVVSVWSATNQCSDTYLRRCLLCEAH